MENIEKIVGDIIDYFTLWQNKRNEHCEKYPIISAYKELREKIEKILLESQSRKENKQRFEHKIVCCFYMLPEVEKMLEKEQKEGWELCGVLKTDFNRYELFFKRLVELSKELCFRENTVGISY